MNTDFKNLNVWHKSMKIVVETYNLIRTLPVEERFGLCDQMRRCSISIPSNIAEGQRRNSNKEFIHFLYISKGSVAELQTQLWLCQNLGYAREEIVNYLVNKLTEIDRMLSGLIKRLSKS